MWETDYLPFDNAPFVVVNHRVYECQHGVDRHLSVKKRNNTVSNNFFRVTKYLYYIYDNYVYSNFSFITLQVGDHSFKRVKKGNMVQESRKLNCKAQVHMRECIKFPGFQVQK